MWAGYRAGIQSSYDRRHLYESPRESTLLVRADLFPSPGVGGSQARRFLDGKLTASLWSGCLWWDRVWSGEPSEWSLARQQACRLSVHEMVQVLP